MGGYESVRLYPPYTPDVNAVRVEAYESRQPILADEVQTFKALITIHKVLQEGHPIAIREAQAHVNWIDSLMRGVAGEGLRGSLLWQADLWGCAILTLRMGW